MGSKFYNKIKYSVDESQVQEVFNEGIRTYFKNSSGENVRLTRPYGTDGVFSFSSFENTKLQAPVKVLVEYKYDINMKNAIERSKVLVQCLFYLKKFADSSDPMPYMLLVGDINECFVLHINPLLKYLEREDINWKIAPSQAGDVHYKLVHEISEDPEVTMFIYDIDDNFSFRDVADKLVGIAQGQPRYVPITEHKLSPIFEYFTTHVLKKSTKLNPNDLVAVFLGAIFNNTEYYVHPKKPNVLVTPKFGEVGIDGKNFKGFFSQFSREYTPKEISRLNSISDRLIEEEKRRRTGEFYTPTPIVDMAHKEISEWLGEDWKEKYVVWDCSCGTKNLTKDYKFSNLFCSTLERAELEISSKYNPEARETFVYDFLNQPLEELPQSLIECFEKNLPIVFFNNPPYGTASASERKGANKEGQTNTLVASKMKEQNFGGSENFQHQFIFRFIQIIEKWNLTNAKIAIFSNPIYITGRKQKVFLENICSKFKYHSGKLFQASHFGNVSGNWGISFSTWTQGTTEDTSKFLHELIDVQQGEIVTVGEHYLYNVNNQLPATNWIVSNIKNDSLFPGVKAALNININANYAVGSMNAIGYLFNNGNNVNKNAQSVGLFSLPFNSGHSNCKTINIDNFINSITLFTARRVILCTWINTKDEYMVPNTSHELWNQYEADSVVYSLFEPNSNQSSLRNIKYKDKLWDIKNEFFWMSKEEMEDLLNISGYPEEAYRDLMTSKDRYVYTWLKENRGRLSQEAEDVLSYAEEIVRTTAEDRIYFDKEMPEDQILNWDAGWYQIKQMLKKYHPEMIKKMSSKMKALKEKLVPEVYELGFLRK